MREEMNLTKRMSQCNSDFKKLQKDIAEKERVIKSKQRDVRSGKYLPAVTMSLEEQIKAYEVALQRDREKLMKWNIDHLHANIFFGKEKYKKGELITFQLPKNCQYLIL